MSRITTLSRSATLVLLSAAVFASCSKKEEKAAEETAPAKTTAAEEKTPEKEPEAPKPAAEPLSVKIETHASQGEKRVVEGASATLASSDEGVEITYDSSGLTPGHIYTIWVVAINDPSACASSPCTPKDVLGNHEGVKADVAFGAGAKADDKGAVSMKATMPVGEWENSWFTGGLTNPTGAEIHLVLNDHGPPIEGREQAMLTSYREGCTDESLPPPFPDTAKADGEPGPNKCALMQDAIFVQAKK